MTLPGRHFDVPLRVDIAHRVVVWQRSKRRGVYAKTLTRSEVSGTTRKARAQKGAGRARVGTLRAPQMRGGGVAHGPSGMRNWNTKLQRARATSGAASGALRKGCGGEGSWSSTRSTGASSRRPSGWTARWTPSSARSPSPREAARTAFCAPRFPRARARRPPSQANVREHGRKLPTTHSNAKRASLNLPHVQVMDQFGLNVYDVLRHRSLAITRDALDALVARLDRPLKPDRAKWSAPQPTPDAAEVLDWTSRGHLGEVDKERKKEQVFKRRAAKKAGGGVSEIGSMRSR